MKIDRIVLLGALLLAQPFLPVEVAVGADYDSPRASTPEYSGPVYYETGPVADPYGCQIETGCQVNSHHVQFSVDLLLMQRSGPNSQDILFDGVAGPSILNASELDFDVEPGVRVNLILMDDCGYDLEFGYFWLGAQETSLSRTGASGATEALFFGGAPIPPAATRIVEYTSELQSGEFNLRKRLGVPMTLLAGLRVASLRENFNILESTDPDTGVFSEVKNRLYGVQVGAEGVLWETTRMRLEAKAKGGIYYNDVDLEAQSGNASFSIDDNLTTFIGEAEIGLVFPLSPHCAMRVGYQAIWLDGVALAPDQNDSFAIFSGAGTIDEGSPVYHGGFIGGQFSW